MNVLVFENNLLWSAKLKLGLQALGHQATVISGNLPDSIEADLAIVNLSQPQPPSKYLIDQLKSRNVTVIAHAGHKEKQLLQLGQEAGADILATNGELSGKLQEVIGRAQIANGQALPNS